MKINSKKLICACLCIIIAGAVLTGIGILLGGWPGVAFSANGIQSPYKENGAYTIEKTKIDPFTNTELKVDSYADIRIQPSDDGQFYLEYKLDGEYGEPQYTVKQDTLTFTHRATPQKGFYFFKIGASSNSLVNAYITLYVPHNRDMGRLSIFNESGDVSVEDLTFGTTKLDVDYGNVDLQNMSFDDLELNVESGNITADSLAAKDILIESEYGDVSLKNISAEEAGLTLESGDLEAKSLNIERLNVTDEYGHLDLDDLSAETVGIEMESGNVFLGIKALTSLACKNAYGDVEIELPKDFADYAVDARCEYGSIKLPSDISQGYHISSDDEAVYRTDGKSDSTIKVDVESGDIIFSESVTASSQPSDEKEQ